MREASDAELVLGALHPPCELDALIGLRLNDFGGARVGRGNEEREFRVAFWVHKGAVYLGADTRGALVESRDLVDWRKECVNAYANSSETEWSWLKLKYKQSVPAASRNPH